MNYLLNFYWSFRSNQPHDRALLRFGAIVATGIVLNTASVSFAVTALGVPALWAAAAFALLWPIVSFGAQKLWAFQA